MEFPLKTTIPNPIKIDTARESPCMSCSTTPCCKYLPLHTFNVRNLQELDHAVYLLNFDRIMVGISSDGNWSAYYYHPCRFLKTENGHCMIHDLPEQPRICVHYNPYSCWYKKALTLPNSPNFIRLNHERINHIMGFLEFDEVGTIIKIPAWETLQEEIGKISLENLVDKSPVVDDSFENWKALVKEETVPSPPENKTFADIASPCTNCKAYCCKYLIFPTQAPLNYSNLDYFKFCLGFPGIEIGVADNGWSIIVKTTCRHLKDNQCSIFGQKERPLICKYYDSFKCTYKGQFGLPRPDNFLRLNFNQFNTLSECFLFDDELNISYFPPMEVIRQHVESKWKSSNSHVGK